MSSSGSFIGSDDPVSMDGPKGQYVGFKSAEAVAFPWIVPLSDELVAMLKKKFQGIGAVFEIENFQREWIKACVKCGLGVKTGEAWFQYKGLVPHDFSRSAVRNLINSGVDMATAMKITGHRTRFLALQYHLDWSTPRSHGKGHVEENGDKMMRNNAKTTQNGVAEIHK